MPHFKYTTADMVSNDEVTVWKDETFEKPPFDLLDGPARAFMDFYGDHDVTTATPCSREEALAWAEEHGEGLEAFIPRMRVTKGA